MNHRPPKVLAHRMLDSLELRRRRRCDDGRVYWVCKQRGAHFDGGRHRGRALDRGLQPDRGAQDGGRPHPPGAREPRVPRARAARTRARRRRDAADRDARPATRGRARTTAPRARGRGAAPRARARRASRWDATRRRRAMGRRRPATDDEASTPLAATSVNDVIVIASLSSFKYCAMPSLKSFCSSVPNVAAV